MSDSIQNQTGNVSGNTPDTVKNNLALGWYIAKFDLSKGASSAFDVIQKVFLRDQDGGARVGNWFHCSRCGTCWQHDSSMGTAPLTRHKENTCPQLTTEQRTQYAKEAAARKTAKATSKSNVKSVKHDGNESTQPTTFSHTTDELFELITESTRIGSIYGTVTFESLKENIPEPKKWWAFFFLITFEC